MSFHVISTDVAFCPFKNCVSLNKLFVLSFRQSSSLSDLKKINKIKCLKKSVTTKNKKCMNGK